MMSLLPSVAQWRKALLGLRTMLPVGNGTRPQFVAHIRFVERTAVTGSGRLRSQASDPRRVLARQIRDLFGFHPDSCAKLALLTELFFQRTMRPDFRRPPISNAACKTCAPAGLSASESDRSPSEFRQVPHQ